MPTLQELIDKRAGIWAQAQEFNERHKKGETMSAEDEASWTRALDEVDELGTQIGNRDRNEKLEKRFEEIDEDTVIVDPNGDRNKGADAKYRAAFDKFCRFGMTDLDTEERQLLQQNFTRAQSSEAGPAGGYTVPQGFWAKVTETQKMFGGVDGYAEQLNTDSGNDIPWATNDDTGNEGEILGQNDTVSDGDLEFGQNTLGASTYSSKLIRVPLQLLQDSGIDIEPFIGRKAGERIGRIQNRHFTAGNGASGQPQGLITGATVGKTTAGATAITYDEMVDLIHSVDPAYRASGRCRWELHDLVLAYVRKIRDDSGGAGVGRPIWEPSVQKGVPDQLLGYEVTVNQHMDSTVTATKKTIGFGDVQAAYVIRKVNGGQLMRLGERYADQLQVGFFAFQRADGLVQDSSAFKVLQQHA